MGRKPIAPCPFRFYWYAELILCGSINLLKLHAAFAGARPGDDRIAGAGTAAVTEIKACAFHRNAFDRLTATAFGRILGIDFAGTTFLAHTDQSLIAFNLYHMPHFQS